MAFRGANLSAIVDYTLPGMFALLQQARAAGSTAFDAKINARHEQDDIVLDVRHLLVSRRDIDNDQWKGPLGPIMRAALGTDGRLAEELAHERLAGKQRMGIRAALARATKPTPYRGTRKKRRMA